MTKKKKTEPILSDLRKGDKVLCTDGVTRTVSKVEPVIDPRGGIYLDSVVQELYIECSDGHRDLLTIEKAQEAVVQLDTRR